MEVITFSPDMDLSSKEVGDVFRLKLYGIEYDVKVVGDDEKPVMSCKDCIFYNNDRRRRLFELQQTYRKINNLRSDFQWGLAHQLCKQYDYIFIEDLNIEGMKRLWGKKVSDLSHSSFIDKLTYVALKYGVIVHKIDKWYPSSKTCECGCINKGLSLRAPHVGVPGVRSGKRP